MAVLCDPPRWPAHGTTFGHLVSDASLDELHDFASRLGLDPRAFDHDHYDLAKERLDRALALGAELTPERQLVARVRAAGLRIDPAQKAPSRAQAIRVLRSRWERLMPENHELGEQLLGRYQEHQRRYHDVRHLAEMVRRLDELGATSRAEQLAAWFHDAVWEGVAGDDEERSAQLAEQQLTGLVPGAEVAEVARLVRLTARHSPRPDDEPGARLCDADLAILGSAPGRYQTSVRDIRIEFGALDDHQWRTGRAAVIERFLAHPHLFTSTEGRSRWEAPARANLRHELDRLAADVATGL